MWAQFYPLENLANTQKSMDTFQNAGCNGIIVTIDQQACLAGRGCAPVAR